MENDRIRTLPPLVTGKHTALLQLLINEVKIVKSSIYTTDDYDILVQILWWGEQLPLLVRPLKVHLTSKRNIGNIYQKVMGHSATYEVHTNLHLFKSYLMSFSVLELVVLDRVENTIIGSAFLNNLVDVVFKQKQLTLPIINYFGNSIGDMKIQVIFQIQDSESVSKHIHPHPTALAQVSDDLKEPPLSNRSTTSSDCKIIETNRLKDYSEIPRIICDKVQGQLKILNITKECKNCEKSKMVVSTSPQSIKSASSSDTNEHKKVFSSKHFNTPLESAKTDAIDLHSNRWTRSVNTASTNNRAFISSHGNVNKVDPFSQNSGDSELENYIKKPSQLFHCEKSVPDINDKRKHMNRKVFCNKINVNDAANSEVHGFHELQLTSQAISNQSKKMSDFTLLVSGNEKELLDSQEGLRLPEAESTDDTSKILLFNLNPGKALATIEKNGPSRLMTNDYRSRKTVKRQLDKNCVEKIPALSADRTSESDRKKTSYRTKKLNEKKHLKDVMKRCNQPMTIEKISREISEIAGKEFSSPRKTRYCESELEKIPVREIKKSNHESKVLDYLLGKDMTSEEEAQALEAFTVMSPCQNIVSAVSYLAKQPEPLSGLPSTNLNYDLSDTIERVYYNTFFKRNESIRDLEIAEILNRPENRYRLLSIPTAASTRGRKVGWTSPIQNNGTTTMKKFDDKGEVRQVWTRSGENNINAEHVETCFDCNSPGFNPYLELSTTYKEVDGDIKSNPTGCPRCKYYKKLEELDKMVNSLKLLERRMLRVEKESETKDKEDSECESS